MKRSPERIQFLSDILTTAIEGGINFWVQVDEYKWENVPEPYAVIEDMYDDNKSYRVDLDLIARGVNRIVKGEADVGRQTKKLITAASFQNDCMPDFVAEKANFGNYYVSDIDAGIADTIVQVGIFGTEEYS
jgi:hypothetical protein